MMPRLYAATGPAPDSPNDFRQLVGLLNRQAAAVREALAVVQDLVSRCVPPAGSPPPPPVADRLPDDSGPPLTTLERAVLSACKREPQTAKALSRKVGRSLNRVREAITALIRYRLLERAENWGVRLAASGQDGKAVPS